MPFYRCPKCGAILKTRYCPFCKVGKAGKMKSLLLVLGLVFSSCSLFQEKEIGPAVESVNAMMIAFNSTSTGFESFITSSKVTMADDVRSALLAHINRDRLDFNTMHKLLLDWLDQAGEIDWQDLYLRLREILEGRR